MLAFPLLKKKPSHLVNIGDLGWWVISFTNFSTLSTVSFVDFLRLYLIYIRCSVIIPINQCINIAEYH